jgi:DNA modification methylase
MAKWGKELSRVLKEVATCYMFESYHNVGDISYMLQRDIGFNLWTTIAIHKINAAPSFIKGRFRNCFEMCLVFFKGKKPNTFHFLSHEDMLNLVDYAICEKKTEDPTEKPFKIIHRLIRISSKVGDRIIDPFVGSGSTMVAAKRLRRSCHGCDITPRYTQMAMNRRIGGER